MKKNLLDAGTADGIIARVQRLTPDTTNLWGQMNATEMLYHCNLANKFIFEDRSPYQRSTFKQIVIKFICFNILPRIPRHNPQPVRINSKGKVQSDLFLFQKALYIETIKRFPQQVIPFASLHPRMGFLTNKEWGLIAWMHMDHHLRQFGI